MTKNSEFIFSQVWSREISVDGWYWLWEDHYHRYGHKPKILYLNSKNGQALWTSRERIQKIGPLTFGISFFRFHETTWFLGPLIPAPAPPPTRLYYESLKQDLIDKIGFLNVCCLEGQKEKMLEEIEELKECIAEFDSIFDFDGLD